MYSDNTATAVVKYDGTIDSLKSAIELCNGFEKLSKTNFENGQKLAKQIESIKGFKKMFDNVHFNEFVIKCNQNPNKINKKLLQKNIQGGLLLEREFPDLKNCILFGITEIHNDADIEKLISALKEFSNV